MLLVSLFSLLLLLVAWSNGENTESQWKVKNCTGNGTFADASNTDIYYQIVGNSSSCTHIVWSMVGRPTMYISHTSINCTCKDSFYNASYTTDQTEGMVNIPGLDSDFSLAIVFNRLVEYNGTKKGYTRKNFYPSLVCNDSEVYGNKSLCALDLKDCNGAWSFHSENTFVLDYSLCSNKSISDCSTQNLTRNVSQFSLSIRTNIPKMIGNHRLKYFPKTLFTENSTTFDIISENYPFYNDESRLALDVMLIHGINVKNGSINIEKTTDDEYTPSVFSSYTYHTNGKASSDDSSEPEGGYLQWKPISYQSKQRKSTSSQQIEVIPAGETCAVDVPNGLATALFGNVTGNVTRLFVLFGTSGDPTYLSESYDTWTVVVGHGTVPQESLSLVVIITILVGVGIPAALVLVGGVYVFIKKRPWDNVKQFISSRSGRGYSKL